MNWLRILRRWFTRKFGFARAVCLLMLIAFVGLRALDPVPIRELRIRPFDTFQLLDPRVKKIRPVTIVDIDEPSLAKLGQWPWPRTTIADMIINLTSLGAVVVAFDVVFSEPDRLNPEVAARTMRYLDEATRARLRELPSNDQMLADAIKRSRVVLGETGMPEVMPDARSETEEALPLTPVATIGREIDPLLFLFQFPGLLRNVPVIERASAGRGLITIVPERDGIIRRVPMVLQAQGNMMPSLTLEMLSVVTGTPTILLTSDDAGIKSVKLRGLEIPTDKNA